jgi:hypothetical protein
LFYDDFRFNGRNVYFTDIGRGAIVVLNPDTDALRRTLDGDPSTKGTRPMIVEGKELPPVFGLGRIFDKGRKSFPHVQEMEIIDPGPDTFTAPVGSYRPNRWGLHDMHGNVWEWTGDWHGDDYYAQSPRDDPRGPADGEVRVRRGGGWNSFPLYARASFRNWNTAWSRCVNLGFRVVREVRDSASEDGARHQGG